MPIIISRSKNILNALEKSFSYQVNEFFVYNTIFPVIPTQAALYNNLQVNFMMEYDRL